MILMNYLQMAGIMCYNKKRLNINDIVYTDYAGKKYKNKQFKIIEICECFWCESGYLVVAECLDDGYIIRGGIDLGNFPHGID